MSLVWGQGGGWGRVHPEDMWDRLSVREGGTLSLQVTSDPTTGLLGMFPH